MTKRAYIYPQLEELRIGRRFRVRPGEAIVKDFGQHVWRTGSPHTWKWITTTQHPRGEAPIIVGKVSIPKRLRNGRGTRAPCSICSVRAPKFDEGFLVFCSDGYLRLIGHECGHDHFDQDSYADALQEHDDEVAEAAVRSMLAERMPDLARTLVEARTLFRDILGVLDFQERAVASITKRAVAAMQRSRIADQLTVEMEMDATDDRGRKVIEKRVVSTAAGLDALSPPNHLLGELNLAIAEAAQAWILQRDEITERLAGMTRQEVFATGKAVRRLESLVEAARGVRTNMGNLFNAEGLAALSAWGRHSHCPTPFWIEVTGERVYLKVGLRPRDWQRGIFLMLPDGCLAEPVIVS